MRNVIIRDETETKKFATDVAQTLKKGDVIALVGDLGTGKTTLSKYIAEALGITEIITSPTFTIVQEYHSGRLPLYHFDVYRVDDIEEMYRIGYEEYFYGEGVCIVEWADIVEEIIPEDAKVIFIEYGEDEGERLYRCTF
ncbi:MAG: tRNA (adenosine(37)-N6)-threonylcarbamoyltransferase complex ATPase subunit type 1 TsaE [[Eubacterium] brachy]|nr:tRNA (adenosine(37)-N6)-threonylcarbamoyltransferase complex ATPase subunit type 1 TsaE [[Eubacterium] brachy]